MCTSTLKGMSLYIVQFPDSHNLLFASMYCLSAVFDLQYVSSGYCTMNVIAFRTYIP